MQISKVAIIGSTGQVGFALLRELSERNINVITIARSKSADIQCDLENPSGLQFLSELECDVIFHAAAFTNVELAETESNTAHTINAESTKIVAKVGAFSNIPLVYFSTEDVFAGLDGPYSETDSSNPFSVYAKTKLLGDHSIQHASK